MSSASDEAPAPRSDIATTNLLRRGLGFVVVSTLALFGVLGAATLGPRTHANGRLTTLRVCSDPNNLPFSDRRERGFENRIAELVARDLGTRVEYTWWAQRRGFLRNTLRAGECDLVMGVPSSMEMVLATAPYYRSTYVFVSRSDRHHRIGSFDDPRLRHLRIGVQLIGDDGVNSPPVHALSNRGIVRNVVGYTVYGDYATPHPASRIIDAVIKGDVDVAVVWGPLAGYFAKHARVPLSVTPVSPQIDLPYLPFVFDISMGVRRGDTAFKARLDSIVVRRAPAIDSILREFGIPRVNARARSVQ
jgi:mxaJ protein